MGRSYFGNPWSLLTPAQRWRRQKDEWYRTSHSSGGKKFVEVDSAVAPMVKAMARSKELHVQRNCDVGFGSHYARNASLAAARSNLIGEDTLKADLRIHRAANAAKHSVVPTPGRKWADIDDTLPDSWDDCVANFPGTDASVDLRGKLRMSSDIPTPTSSEAPEGKSIACDNDPCPLPSEPQVQLNVDAPSFIPDGRASDERSAEHLLLSLVGTQQYVIQLLQQMSLHSVPLPHDPFLSTKPPEPVAPVASSTTTPPKEELRDGCTRLLLSELVDQPATAAMDSMPEQRYDDACFLGKLDKLENEVLHAIEAVLERLTAVSKRVDALEIEIMKQQRPDLKVKFDGVSSKDMSDTMSCQSAKEYHDISDKYSISPDIEEAVPTEWVDPNTETDELSDEEPRPCFLRTFPYARLTDLKTERLNGLCGELLEHPLSLCDKERVPFLVSATKERIKVKQCNLKAYKCQEDDLCTACCQVINLSAFPPCMCSTSSEMSNQVQAVNLNHTLQSPPAASSCSACCEPPVLAP